MKKAEGGRSRGYTILETMIFLAVSAAMFVSAMALINGRQQRTEFTAAVRDFEAAVNDIANDVSTGYYANATATGERINCDVSGSGNIQLKQSGSDTQGKSLGCIFIGKAVQFSPADTSRAQYNIISLVGKQYKGGVQGNGDVENLDQSTVTPVAPADGDPASFPDATISQRIGGGVTAECVLYSKVPVTPASPPCSVSPRGVTSSGATVPMASIDTVAFITTFHGLNYQGTDKESGSSQVNLVVPKASYSIDRATKTAMTTLKSYTQTNTETNPGGGVYVCLQSNGSNQYALISLGGSNSRFSSNTTIRGGRCS
ncbi:MAG: hypothetical protein JWN82_633 [Candidatus Saccharibacteria bacterium]|nr:hypothetical protein [Candidatus Saccharibacteria bacterium]